MAVRDLRSTATKSLQGETLDVKVVARNICISQIRDDVVDHPDRTADVDVPLGDVGHELLQVRRREQMAAFRRARVVADDVVDLDAAPSSAILSSSGPKTMSAVGDDAIERDDVAVHLLEQGAHRA